MTTMFLMRFATLVPLALSRVAAPLIRLRSAPWKVELRSQGSAPEVLTCRATS